MHENQSETCSEEVSSKIKFWHRTEIDCPNRDEELVFMKLLASLTNNSVKSDLQHANNTSRNEEVDLFGRLLNLNLGTTNSSLTLLNRFQNDRNDFALNSYQSLSENTYDDGDSECTTQSTKSITCSTISLNSTTLSTRNPRRRFLESMKSLGDEKTINVIDSYDSDSTIVTDDLNSSFSLATKPKSIRNRIGSLLSMNSTVDTQTETSFVSHTSTTKNFRKQFAKLLQIDDHIEESAKKVEVKLPPLQQKSAIYIPAGHECDIHSFWKYNSSKNNNKQY